MSSQYAHKTTNPKATDVFFMAVSPRITGKRSYTSWKSVLLAAYWPVARLKCSGVLRHRCTFNEVTVAEKQGHDVRAERTFAVMQQ